ncbi:glycosyltransferase family 9 protein [Hippea alviniae]|uniref:glycosyltransferase family 9 protein n=1 Tax=Hippea alviniae TaxID=1279027 RepID=UPI0003B505B3|nr:glycosyltransferase family 9 protein [Hippea alviniae]
MKVLIIQIKQLGDVLLSTPLAEAIKHHLPKTEVHFLTSKRAEEIVSLNPFIDKIHTIEEGIINEIKVWFKVRKEQYDAVLDIQRTGRSKRITLFSKAKIRAAFDEVKDKFYYNTIIDQTTSGYTAFERLDMLKAIGIYKPKRFMPKLFSSNKDLENVKHYLAEKGIFDKFFVVSPTARKPNKMWQAEDFGKTAQALSEHFNLTPIIVYGTEKEKPIAFKVKEFAKDSIVLEKPFSVKQFAALVKLSKFFIGNDSFASHVAVSQQTKTIVICGPTAGWFIENENTILIYKGLKCQPCGSADKCPYDLECYRTLKDKDVLKRAIPFLEQAFNSKP